ncbi:hypothetical protein MSAN_00549600 [Mycena sanguinolenta]|uniref:Uncharacterized protein n=1 Tax=Mycena sanguinolenta TaxID=230812 RepID=A0A8H6ZCY6_9AGAR|nr:hypothetical protein MSAN_00549600 [Mycena sanguinolenta]
MSSVLKQVKVGLDNSKSWGDSRRKEFMTTARESIDSTVLVMRAVRALASTEAVVSEATQVKPIPIHHRRERSYAQDSMQEIAEEMSLELELSEPLEGSNQIGLTAAMLARRLAEACAQLVESDYGDVLKAISPLVVALFPQIQAIFALSTGIVDVLANVTEFKTLQIAIHIRLDLMSKLIKYIKNHGGKSVLANALEKACVEHKTDMLALSNRLPNVGAKEMQGMRTYR